MNINWKAILQSHVSVKSGFCLVLLLLILSASAAETKAGIENKPNAKISSRSNVSKQKGLWQPANEKSLAKIQNLRETKPEKYLVFSLNQESIKNTLSRLPLENTDAARDKQLMMEIPMPDGSLKSFRMEETQVLSEELAADFPDWKTFTGYAIDDSNVVGRFDWNSFGFHGYISTGQGTVMIDPYVKGDTDNYLVFYKHDFGAPSEEFYCNVEQSMKKIVSSDFNTDFSPSAPTFSLGASLRTYRLAVATTGEWARNAAGYNGTQTPVQIRTGALAVITTTVNRLNGIYTRELASTFQLVNPPVANNATNIVFDDPATDPYDNTDSGAQLNINQTTITSRRGTANFDIGHLYGTGGGGVAASPSLCDDAAKAQGYSARGTNTGDPFVVDYVAHEIGHQFGANHTYNNSDPSGACTTRSPANAFEVASGATLMSYVGICEARNLQQYVDTGFPSFHIRSLTEINTNVTTGDPATTGCGTASGTNNIPTVSAGAAYTIPRLTPFTLTAAGGDADASDVANLLYSWEEYDLAPSSSGASGNPAGSYDVDTDGVLRPLFRAYSPVSGTARTFPSLTFILNPAGNDASADVSGVRGNQPVLTYTGTHPTNAPGAVCEPSVTCVVGERLPTVNRTMNFRVSARDRRGGVVDAGTTVTVAAAAGPFQVTTQNTAPVTWTANTQQTVTWDVAGTAANGINTANVAILLSTDGGQTFPTTLAASVPNNGSAQITIPNNPTTTARIKVAAVGNVFFDINNVNFTIMAPTAAVVSVSGRVLSQQGKGIAGALIRITGQNGKTLSVLTNAFGYYNLMDVSAGQTYVFSVTAKNYRFAPQVASLTENLSGLNFRAQ